MLTCILSFSACGSETQYSDYQQQKLDEARQRSLNGYIPILSLFSDDEMLDSFKEYTAEEIETIFGNEGLYVDGNGFISAASSFNLNSEITGQFSVKPEEPVDVTVDGKKIIVHIQVAGEKKDAEVELVLSNDMFWKLESGSLNPISSFGELMEKAGLNTVLGMGTVFTILILISLIIGCFSFIPRIQKAFTKKNKEEVNVTGINNAVAQIAQQEEASDESDDMELVSVIAAAIAAYEGSSDASGYVVRSIRKINR